MKKKILVVAPHPDDEILGCGGTIAKETSEGNEVQLCIVTKAYTPDWTEKFIEQRKKDIQDSSRILGISRIHLLDYPTVKLDTIPQKELNDAFANLLRMENPDELYVPFRGDLNIDHRIVYDSVMVAARPHSNRRVRILSYETLSETEWGQQSLGIPFSPNVYMNIENHLKQKLDAMQVYVGTEVKKHPHPRSLEMVEILAKKRGSESGLNLAEAFMLIREVK